MAFGGEVHDGARAVLLQQTGDQPTITDVAARQGMTSVTSQCREIANVTSVSQFVEIDHRLVLFREPVQHEVGANESGTAGDENGHSAAFCRSRSFAYLLKLFMQPMDT